MKTKYRTILIDPPWNERGGGKIKRGADKHYSLLKTHQIPDVIKSSNLWEVEDNAHLWLWSTNNHLPDALWLIKELGFIYKTNLVWVKNRIGLGQYLRGQHELLLFATRGKGQDGSVWQQRRDIPSVLLEARTEHSRKPNGSYQIIEKISKGPYLELFARQQRKNWTVWGNEV